MINQSRPFWQLFIRFHKLGGAGQLDMLGKGYSSITSEQNNPLIKQRVCRTFCAARPFASENSGLISFKLKQQLRLHLPVRKQKAYSLYSIIGLRGRRASYNQTHPYHIVSRHVVILFERIVALCTAFTPCVSLAVPCLQPYRKEINCHHS